MQELIQLAAIVLLLILSFIFSGSEVAILSISELDRLKISKEKIRKNLLLLHYLRFPQKALVTILVGNMVVNLSASIIGEGLSRSFFPNNPLFYSVFIMTFLVLLFGEIVPKNFATTVPILFSTRFIPIINLTNKLFYPFIFLIQGLIRKSSGFRKKLSLSKEELLTAIESGSKAGIHGTSINILKNMVHLIDKPITDIMVPRSEIRAIDIDEYWNKMEKFIADSPFSTVLFYEADIDHILGYLKITDLLDVRKKDIREKLRNPLYFPETKHILLLLSEFKESGNYMAVILDEYGGTTGIVTLKDILDAIFIRDMILEKFIQKKDKNHWLVHGNTKISDINSALDMNLSQESNTIGGYIVNLIGSIPDVGMVIDITRDFKVNVLRSDRKQIGLMEFVKHVH
jgi:CBS domain containing-hemolysin-like protein